MDDVYCKKIAELSDKKENLLLKIDLKHKELSEAWQSLNQQFEEFYPFLDILDLCYEIKYIDFHFGEIACKYRGDDNALSADLFAFNNRLENVLIPDLSCPQLIDIYNFLVKISRDVFGFDCEVIVDCDRYTTNDIIEKIKQLTEKITYEGNIHTDEKINDLTKAIQKMYVMIDFLLYTDEAQEKIRVAYNDFLYFQEISYVEIDSYRMDISEIDEQLKKLNASYDQERVESDALPKINPEAIQRAIAKQEELKSNEVRQEKANKAKSVIVSIPLSILGALEVHLIYGLVNFIVSLLFWILLYIPIVRTIVGYGLARGDNTPDMFSMYAATIFAYFIFMEISECLLKKTETKKITFMLTGIYLLVFNILFVIINLKYNDPILGNTLLSIAGIVIFYKGKTK